MDLDLLSDFVQDRDVPSLGQLLSNLPDRRLTFEADANNLPLFRDDSPNVQAPISRVVNPSEPGAVISKIEHIFDSMTECILGRKKELVIQLKTRVKSKTSADNRSSEGKTKAPKTDTRNITFPSKSRQEAWRFSK